MKESIVELLRQRPDAAAAFVVGFGLLIAFAALNAELPSGVAFLLGGVAIGCFVYPIATS